MGEVPYEMKPRPGLQVQGGQIGCFELSFPSRATINKILIQQTDAGPAVGFTVQLFNHISACEGIGHSESYVPPDEGEPVAGDVPSRMYQVTPLLNSTGPGYFEYYANAETGGDGYDFFSHDETAQQAGARIGNARTLYLRIQPAGIGLKEFCVLIGGGTLS